MGPQICHIINDPADSVLDGQVAFWYNLKKDGLNPWLIFQQCTHQQHAHSLHKATPTTAHRSKGLGLMPLVQRPT